MFFKSKEKKLKFEGEGIILFPDVASAIQAEKVLAAADYQTKLVAPPPELRKGCDLGLEINLTEKLGIERLLKAKRNDYLDILPVKGAGELLSIVQITDFGAETMVKAGNMKLTFDKQTGTILNISGGGCPDIPYLHLQMVGKPLHEAPRPKAYGFTLCSLMLDRAFIEALEILEKREEQ